MKRGLFKFCLIRHYIPDSQLTIWKEKYPYNEIVSFLKGPLIKKPENEEVLNNSQIILLTISDIRQTADISNSFEALQKYLNNPFMSGETYGYPIFCKGMNNSTFIPGK